VVQLERDKSRKLLTPALGGRLGPAGWVEQRRSMAARVSLTGRGRPPGCRGDSPVPSARPAGSRWTPAAASTT